MPMLTSVICLRSHLGCTGMLWSFGGPCQPPRHHSAMSITGLVRRLLVTHIIGSRRNSLGVSLLQASAADLSFFCLQSTIVTPHCNLFNSFNHIRCARSSQTLCSSTTRTPICARSRRRCGPTQTSTRTTRRLVSWSGTPRWPWRSPRSGRGSEKGSAQPSTSSRFVPVPGTQLFLFVLGVGSTRHSKVTLHGREARNSNRHPQHSWQLPRASSSHRNSDVRPKLHTATSIRF